MTLPPINRSVSIPLAARVVARFAWRFGREAGPIALAACGFSLGLIWFGAWWATYVLPFGGWGRPEPSGCRRGNGDTAGAPRSHQPRRLIRHPALPPTVVSPAGENGPVGR